MCFDSIAKRSAAATLARLFFGLLIASLFVACPMSGMNQKDAISGDSEIAASRAAPGEQIVSSIELYKGTNFSGEKLTIYMKTFSDGRKAVTNDKGIDLANFPSSWNNQVRSVRLIRGNSYPSLLAWNSANMAGTDVQYYVQSSNPDVTSLYMSSCVPIFDATLPQCQRYDATIFARWAKQNGSDYDETRRYLTAEDQTNRPIKPAREVMGDWETFELRFLDADNKFFTMYSRANNNYVIADRNQNSSEAPLCANWTESTPRPWMFFRIGTEMDLTGRNAKTYRVANSIYAVANGRRVYAVEGLPLTTFTTGRGFPGTGQFWIVNRAPADGATLMLAPYSADPSVHYFNDRFYIYGSHDRDAATDPAMAFKMNDYYVYSMFDMNSRLEQWPYALNGSPSLTYTDVAWVKQSLPQFWAPDAAKVGNNTYLYFPARDNSDAFRIGAAVNTENNPAGRFSAYSNPIAGTFSIDPSVFQDGSNAYMVFGGVWGGQLEQWQYIDASSGTPVQRARAARDPNAAQIKDGDWALGPVIARMNSNMTSLAETPRPIVIKKDGAYMKFSGADTSRSYFEAPWIVKVGSTYYLCYSTGPSRYFSVASSSSIYGPYNYVKDILVPSDTLGTWTTHGSVINTANGWYVFYHDATISPSGTATDKRSIKYKKLSSFP